MIEHHPNVETLLVDHDHLYSFEVALEYFEVLHVCDFTRLVEFIEVFLNEKKTGITPNV